MSVYLETSKTSMNYSSLIEDIAAILKKINWHLVTAESCTGGLIASELTAISGSSVWFERGFVTYSNLSKQEMLGVPKKLIEGYGAVSEEVALAMALGALSHSQCQVAVSVTGIAGPDGGTTAKPVGTVYLAWAVLEGESHCIKKQFMGTRAEVRSASCWEALQGLLLLLKKIQ